MKINAADTLVACLPCFALFMPPQISLVFPLCKNLPQSCTRELSIMLRKSWSFTVTQHRIKRPAYLVICLKTRFPHWIDRSSSQKLTQTPKWAGRSHSTINSKLKTAGRWENGRERKGKEMTQSNLKAWALYHQSVGSLDLNSEGLGNGSPYQGHMPRAVLTRLVSFMWLSGIVLLVLLSSHLNV